MSQSKTPKTSMRVLQLAALTLMLGAAGSHAQSGAQTAPATPSASQPSAAQPSTPAGNKSDSSMSSGSGASSGTGSSGASGSGTGSTATPESNASGATSMQKPGTGASVNAADRRLMRDLTLANMSEVEMGRVALTKTQNDQVKTFAQKMIDDHTAAFQKLQALAVSKGVSLPSEMDSKSKAALKKLSALNGDAFDRQYMAKGGVTDHQATHLCCSVPRPLHATRSSSNLPVKSCRQFSST